MCRTFLILLCPLARDGTAETGWQEQDAARARSCSRASPSLPSSRWTPCWRVKLVSFWLASPSSSQLSTPVSHPQALRTLSGSVSHAASGGDLRTRWNSESASVPQVVSHGQRVSSTVNQSSPRLLVPPPLTSHLHSLVLLLRCSL